MLKVREALRLEVFQDGRLVAGDGGLDQVINWVHTVGVPDAARWLNGGELVLTTIINMPEGEGAQTAYLQAMIEANVVGLVVTIGQKLDRIPDYLCLLADRHNFPLIEIPYTARFVDIARVINEQIVQGNLSMLSRALTIHQTLTRIVLERGGVVELANTLAGLINQSVSIETARFEALASVNIKPVDEARRYTQQYGRTDPRLVEALEDQILPKIRETMRPVFIPQMPYVGLEMERILAPIVVHGAIYGYVWIIADDRPVSDLDYMAIESGAMIAALILLYQESIQNAEASLKGSLLTRLIQGETNGDAVLTDQALRYGLDLRQPYRMMLVDDRGTSTREQLAIYRRINQLIDGQAAIAGQFAGHVVMIIQVDTVPPFAVRIQAEEMIGRVGVSAEHVGSNEVMVAYGECGEVLAISSRLYPSSEVVYFDDLGYLHALYHAGPEALRGNPYIDALTTLSNEQQADLFHTLEVYLDSGGNGVYTAEKLHIHRSTLNYRLQRIAEICDVQLSDSGTRMNLQVALKLLRLFGG